MLVTNFIKMPTSLDIFQVNNNKLNQPTTTTITTVYSLVYAENLQHNTPHLLLLCLCAVLVCQLPNIILLLISCQIGPLAQIQGLHPQQSVVIDTISVTTFYTVYPDIQKLRLKWTLTLLSLLLATDVFFLTTREITNMP